MNIYTFNMTEYKLQGFHVNYKFCKKCKQNKELSSVTFRQCKYSSGKLYYKLKNHLESQFDDNMNWTNYGTYWHIDHIIPQSLLSYMTLEGINFQKCWSLNNLRPLEAKQNMLDGSARIRHKMYITNNGVVK